jgi:hypothetical protein
MKVAFVIFALFYVHIARGSPLPEDKPAAPAQDKPDPAAAAPQADAAPEKPDICKVNVNGKEESLKPGDRYCKDDATNGVCGYGGETHEFPCDSGFKCHKHPNEWKVTCLKLNLNAGVKFGEDGNAERSLNIGGVKHNAEHDSPSANAPQNDNANPAPVAAPTAPKHEEPAPPGAPTAERPPQPTAPKHEEPAPPGAPKEEPKSEVPTAPKHEEPAPPGAPKEEPKKSQPTAPLHEEPPPPGAPKTVEPVTPKPETCKATIDGKEQTLQPGDRYCLSDTVNRVCNWGEFVDYDCPNNSKCLKSPDKWAVLCRIVNRADNVIDKAAAAAQPLQ